MTAHKSDLPISKPRNEPQSFWLRTVRLVASSLVVLGLMSGERLNASDDLPMALSRFANKYCVACHGPAKQEGRVRLDHLPADSRAPHAAQLLSQIHIQLRDGLMPPDDAPQPSRAELREVVSGLDQVLASLRPPGQLTEDQLPNKGNLVPHGLLFGTPVSSPTASPARVWRLNSASYLQMLRGVYRSSRIKDEVVEPFTLIPDRGFKDYAALYSLDEPTTEILLRNAAIIVNRQCEYELKDGAIKPKGWDTVREFVALMDPELSPTRDQIDKAVELQYRLAIGRVPTREQLDRYFALYERCAADGNRPEAIKTVLQAVLLHADAIFRSELGGAPDETGRRMLTPLELAEALSFALGNKRSDVFTSAAERGDLASPMQVSELLRTALSAKDNRADTSRLLTFFQQYFDYYRAPEVFKADRIPFPSFANEWEELGGQFPKGFTDIRGALHSPATLVADTDALIQYVLEQDKEVLRTLLTIDVTYANATWKQDKATRQLVLAPAFVRNENNHRGIGEPHYVYGFEKWPQHQPAQPPSDKPRLGVLMQPAWLVAHSTNFENDPVRRGRWIRERLLGQTVPDLPIDVAAQVPDDPHRTYRDRLTVTRDNKCWKCHQWMDDLGLPFEQFTHYGLHRDAELVEDEATSRKRLHRNGEPIKQFHPQSLDTTGVIDLTEDPQLDGPVRYPYELVRRLADSQRVRQVFVRHAFRYFLGRNETLADASVLQAADRAYVNSGGSFRELVISLLTSDSFLYRVVED